jgi:hypothetical protein
MVLSLKDQMRLEEKWKKFNPGAEVQVAKTIHEAIKYAKDYGSQRRGLHTLATGDFHMVGGILTILNSDRS